MATGSNSAIVDFGTAGSAWGTLTHYTYGTAATTWASRQ